MRITNKLMNTQALQNYQFSAQSINKANSKLASGLEIQNSYDNSSVYVDGVRLDYEISSIDQIQEAAQKAMHFSRNSDKALQEFVKMLENFKTKLIQAGNASNSTTSLGALADELQGIKDYLVQIANTSINGQYLFSGSDVRTKPIGSNNQYMGNNDDLKSVVGAHTALPYNIPGEQIFYGVDNDYSKHVSTNVDLTDRSLDDTSKVKHLTSESKIMHLIGKDYKEDRKLNEVMDFTDDKKYQNTVFYMRGVKPDGTSFNSKFELTSDASMQDLLDKIGEEYGNTKTNRVVDVSIDKSGHINITNLEKGNQKLDFYLVGATDQKATAGTSGDANANSLEELEEIIKNKDNPASPHKDKRIHITEFIKSNYFDSKGDKTNVFDYDKVRFVKQGSEITGSFSQIVRKDNSFAKDTTRLSEVAAGGSVVGSKLEMKVHSKNGKDYTISIDFTNKNEPKVNFKEDGVAGAGYTTKIYHTKWNPGDPNAAPIVPPSSDKVVTQADDVTFRQLNDIIAMAVSDNIPSPDNKFDPAVNPKFADDFERYNAAINESKYSVDVNMDNKGRISIKDRLDATSKIEISVYDPDGAKFNANKQSGSKFLFSANNAVTIDEPSNNIFDDLDEMIKAVRNGYYRSGNEKKDPRNMGIQAALKRIDHIHDHVIKNQTKLGAYTNSLVNTETRAKFMKVNISKIKNELIGADYAETYLKMMQQIMSYQAMLQANAKIQQLSLLNYM